jgi:hypothetical protein
MTWYSYLAYFIAGVFLANGVPHFANGISGKHFPSPFASPPGIGKSSPVVNVLWGTLNFCTAYMLLTSVGNFQSGISLDTLFVAFGILMAGTILASHFGKIQASYIEK